MLRLAAAAAAAASLALATPALAQTRTEQEVREGLKGTGAYGAAGCGLGSMAFGTQPGFYQVLAATTNGILGNQTFGITSGTMNCGSGMIAQRTRDFVEANRQVLAKDAARGEGEAIGALTVINGCADSRAVGAALQGRYAEIFPAASATDAEVADAILRALRTDPALGCAQG